MNTPAAGQFQHPVRRKHVALWMFAYAEKFDQPLDNFETSSITEISDMFFNATSFDQYIASWDRTSAVTRSMFLSSGFTYPDDSNAFDLLFVSQNKLMLLQIQERE